MQSESVYDALKSICQSRRSVRSFTDQRLTEQQIAAVCEIARTAPFASGKKNWELLVITDRSIILELAKIVKTCTLSLGARIRDDFREPFLDYACYFSAFESAPALFIPVYRVQPSLSLMLDESDQALLRWERDNVVKSISGATMLILLTAESLGLGACCMTGPLLAETEIARKIRLKQGFEIAAVIPVGHRCENLPNR